MKQTYLSRAWMLAFYLLCQLCHLIASVQMLVAIVIGSPRAWALAVSYDQLGNVILGGDEDTTISARAWEHRHTWRWELMVRLLDKIDPSHCYKAWSAEKGRRRV